MISTLNQFAAADHDRMVEEYGVSLAESQRLYPVESYRGQWWSYVVDAFNAGDDFSPQAMVTLTSGQLRDLSRTTRSLRDGMPLGYCYRAGNLNRAIAR